METMLTLMPDTDLIEAFCDSQDRILQHSRIDPAPRSRSARPWDFALQLGECKRHDFRREVSIADGDHNVLLSVGQVGHWDTGLIRG